MYIVEISYRGDTYLLVAKNEDIAEDMVNTLKPYVSNVSFYYDPNVTSKDQVNTSEKWLKKYIRYRIKKTITGSHNISR